MQMDDKELIIVPEDAPQAFKDARALLPQAIHAVDRIGCESGCPPAANRGEGSCPPAGVVAPLNVLLQEPGPRA